MPKGWERTSLQNLVVVNYGKALPEQARNAEGSIPVFGSSGVVGKHDAAITSGPSVIVGRKGAAGAVHLVDRPCWPIDTAYFIEPPAGLSVRWLHYFLGSQQLVRLDKSTAIPSLSRDDLYNELVPVAPELEQGRVLEKLEELLSDLDAGEAELKAAQKKLTQYRQSLLKAAVEGALTAPWREQQRAQHPPAESGAQLLQRILTERRARWEAKQLAKFEAQGKAPPKDWQKKYPEPVQPDTTDMPALPQGWVWASVAQLGEVTTGFTPSTSDPKNFGGGIPFFKPTDLDAGYEVRSSRESLTEAGASTGRVLPAGSILVTCIGATIGKTGLARVPCATNQQINAVSVDRVNVLPEFLYWMICSGFGQRQIIGNASATTLPILNKSKFEKVALPLPPLSEQREIVSLIEGEVDRLRHLGESLIHASLQSTAQRQNILRAAFSGQLVPQDPNDEPAADLLARIRAERAAQAPVRKPRGRRAQEAA
nr:restriction endonuclease subunit S [Aquabacterium fontiphilum]